MPGASTRPEDPDTSGTESVDEEFTLKAVGPEADISTAAMVPDIFTTPPPIRDILITDTSDAQDETVESCLPFLKGEAGATDTNEYGLPRLAREKHIKFLHSNLGILPAPFVAADASRPWFLYWCLSGLTMLGEDVSPYRERLIETARAMQNPKGGFGGGHGQLSHLATTYAVILSLALMGSEDCYEVIDRRALWRWLWALKQPDGGFTMSIGGEEDIRGAYCATVIVSLLGLPLNKPSDMVLDPAWGAEEPDMFTRLPDWVRRCQTFEGGISGEPDAEAHGAYAFCALGCLSILGSPDQTIPRYLDVPRLLSWLSSRQYAPEGGFSGRTNKLVDGCYSHWVGGCWPLIEACLGGTSPAVDARSGKTLAAGLHKLFSREGLMRYIFCCCQDQSRRGGLRDKPGKLSDAYHSCYVLSGLSAAEHRWELKPEADMQVAGGFQARWTVSTAVDEVQIFDEQDRVGTIHPVYAIPVDRVDKVQEYFLSKGGF